MASKGTFIHAPDSVIPLTAVAEFPKPVDAGLYIRLLDGKQVLLKLFETTGQAQSVWVKVAARLNDPIIDIEDFEP